MTHQFTRTRKIALMLLVIISFNILSPSMAYALTSGPVQPETKGFQPAGGADMVDLATGNFKYNIPLLDIDGYPINLNYASGVNMDDEASWVGLGWSLSPGAINRQVRGIPDDFSGESIETDHWTKPKITVGGKLTQKAELVGFRGINGSFSLGVFSDNYTGIGAEVGVNAGISYSFGNSGFLTAGLGVSVLSNTQSGVDVTPYASLSLREKASDNMSGSAGATASLSYNSRSGLKNLSLGTSFGVASTYSGNPNDQQTYNVFGSTTSYNTEPLSPTCTLPYMTTYSSFSFDVGAAIYVVYPSTGGMGYKSTRSVLNYVNTKDAYGFLYAERGKDNPNAQMDFIREKDNPIIKGIPNIAVPIQTPDLWSYTSQSGSGQFRLYRGGSGAYFDAEADDQSKTSTNGGDLGAGEYFHGGVTHFEQHTSNVTRKWQKDNNYLPYADFQDPSTSSDLNYQHAYFRQVGEKNVEDEDVNPQLLNTSAVAVHTSGTSADPAFTTAANPAGSSITGTIRKTKRRHNRTEISYLTAAEAALPNGSLDRYIQQYAFNTFNTSTAFVPPANNKPLPVAQTSRVDNTIRKPNHISEIRITDDAGKRMVYGIPVYNTLQTEATFAVSPSNGGLTDYGKPGAAQVPSDVLSPVHSSFGLDNYFNKETKPAYASSFLLTAVLSPDYVDRTGNGITDDDLGTAVKFNYSKTANYRWRAPYQDATLNKGLLADPDDDKGSVIYGEKELWYVSSIETKTKVVYFITADRQDGLGVRAGWQTGGMDNTQTQKLLKEIRVYSKADRSRPIKVVKFDYNYSLCPNIPNSAGYNDREKTGPGKLTLASVWFEYGNSDKGSNFKYRFNYDTNNDPGYKQMSTDRWGNYKDANANPGGMDNEHDPYSDQNPVTNVHAGLWHLQQIDLPTGGTINVSYEAGDYAYVQDKKAMVMTGVQGLVLKANGRSGYLNDAVGVAVHISADDAMKAAAAADQTTWFKDYMLNGSEYLYTKFYVNMQTNNDDHANDPDPDRWWDYIPCYAKVQSVTINGQTANVAFESITDGGVTDNPIAIAAWQRLKNEYPRYAYPGYNSRLQSQNSGAAAAVGAIVDAAKNLTELFEKFYTKANRKNFCSQIDPSKSFVRLAKTDGKKLGGETRVSKISITDNWGKMDANGAAKTYGQAYTYTLEDGHTSSGVASYEPAIGSDENPLRQPVKYVQTVAGGINNYFDLEEPFAESLFPAPQVVYSRVTVHDLDHTLAPSSQTGYTVNESYTAKDFPVKVTVLPLASYSYEPKSKYTITSSNSIDELTLSQGYSIETNDMHGKLKATRVFNQAGAEISSTVYDYNAVENGGSMALNNLVNVICQNGQQKAKYMGRDIEFFTDFREQESINLGNTIDLGVDVFPFYWPPVMALPHVPSSENNDYKLFRSASALKVIQDFGILNKVIKTQNGSSITTENLAFDALTGEAIVTRTQNEFNKYIYSVNMPAYWVYNNMGGSYQTADVIVSDLQTDLDGVLNKYNSFFTPGDELLNLTTGERYWITGEILIDRNGAVVKNLNSTAGINNIPWQALKVVRSGFRNMLNVPAMAITCLNNPIVNNQLLLTSFTNLTQQLKVINASASTFQELWAVKPACSNDHTIEDTHTTNFVYQPSTPNPNNHGRGGAMMFSSVSNNTSYSHISGSENNSFITTRLDNSGIWMGDISGNIGLQIGFETDFTIPQDPTGNGYFYIGYSGDDEFSYTIDQTAMPVPPTPPIYSPSVPASNIYFWYLIRIPLTPGTHHLSATGRNISFPDPANNIPSMNPGALGLEIYKDRADFNSSNVNDYRIIFSTSSLAGSHMQSSIVKSDNIKYNRFDYKYCINPYIDGFLGNWRPYQSLVFQQNRNSKSDLFTSANKGVNVKDAGYINDFYSYWNYSYLWQVNLNGSRWTPANTVTLYDRYGQQIENKDALNRYSAANFDFNGELPSAVASNAKNRDIYSNSFEDLLFNPGRVTQTCIMAGINELQTSTSLIQGSTSHSGNYSLLLPSAGINLSTNSYVSPPVNNALLLSTDFAEYNVQKDNTTQKDVVGVYPNGFEPTSNQPYLFDVWVYDNFPTNKDVNISLTVNTTQVSGLTCKAVVEGWKLIEAKLDPALITSGPINFKIAPLSGVVYIDDLRIHPYTSQMKTYAYDDKTLRLMAELDENCFATFYEYDDEGLLIRVKKETAKGVMTLKESRSSYQKTLLP